MASYRLNDAAFDDLDRVYEYGILTFGLKQANDYYDGLILLFQKIANNPLFYQAVDHIRLGYRRATYSRDSVYYRIEGDSVVIAGILGQQDTTSSL